ncbi:MAG: hypothetical protein IT425_10320 [Pirellulales bacterium]|nr:hypothetical protein [Pirellulales bacterium]
MNGKHSAYRAWDVLVLAVVLAMFGTVSAAREPAELAANNVVWTTPSRDPAGSMPIGNGEVGLNVWVESDGDLLFTISRTDAWSECNRLLKLGRVRVQLSPNPFVAGQPFRQELTLREGQIVVQAGDARLTVFVDALAPVVYVTGQSQTPRSITATFESWRTEKRVLKGDELKSSWTMLNAPDEIEVWESADVVTNSPANAVLAYHRNAYSVVPLTIQHQGLASLGNAVRDPLVHRTFGSRLAGTGLVANGASSLRSNKPLKTFDLTIATHTAQRDSLAEWERELPTPVPVADALRRTEAWWSDFWDRSWINVTGDAEQGGIAADVSRGYALQRWITACGGRGAYPIKFNGSIFTVEPKFSGGPAFNADWREWGDCYWWQNTRIPYFAMIARGDFDQLDPLFRLHRNVLPLCEGRARLYYQAEGVYFPETMTIFGTYSNQNYGWNREGHKPNEVLSPWWQYAWQQGLELTALMLDYYEHTQNEKFLHEELIPMANSVLRYYDSRFSRDDRGKLVISPTQAVETYWIDVVNDTPSVAGLTNVCERLTRLPASAEDHAFWRKMQAATPDVPVRGGRIQPAERFNPKRTNVENPELYALWPFRVFGVGRPELPIAIETFRNRPEKASIGWQYDGQCAAIAGLADESQRILVGKVGNSNQAFRFPAMWGPNYDWLPDQDHGGNIMLTLQSMVLQTDGDKIFLLPAWPKAWNVSFKLHAPRQTVVEGVFRDGKLQRLTVTPTERRADIVTDAPVDAPVLP